MIVVRIVTCITSVSVGSQQCVGAAEQTYPVGADARCRAQYVVGQCLPSESSNHDGDEWGSVPSVSAHPEDCSPSVPQMGRGLPWGISGLGEVLYFLCLWLESCHIPSGPQCSSLAVCCLKAVKSTLGSVALAPGFEWDEWLLGALHFLCLLTFQMVLEISLVDQNREGIILGENLILLLTAWRDYILQRILYLPWALEEGVEERNNY